MKKIITLAFLFATTKLQAQELFVFTEPASNMASKTVGVRLDNMFVKNDITNNIVYTLSPEVMLGISKKIMLHATGYFDNTNNSFKAAGAALYAKYRFYSEDEVHSHFRMAAFGRLAFNNKKVEENTISVGRKNSGYEAGVVATKLVNKIAASSIVSFVHALNNGNNKFLPVDKYRNGINYSLSAGKLMLPKEYTSYKQVNMNLMLEFLGQTNVYYGSTFIDAAASVQFIFNSRIRVDAGYRVRLLNNYVTHEQNTLLLRLEYNFYNVFK